MTDAPRTANLAFLEPLGVSQVEAAARMSIPFQRLNAIVKGRRAVSADTALLLEALTGWDATDLARAAGEVGPVARAESPRQPAEGSPVVSLESFVFACFAPSA